MKVLCVTNVFPLPPDNGGAVRVLGMLDALVAAHEVHVLALARPDAAPGLAGGLQERLGHPVEVFPHPPAPADGVLPAVGRWREAIRRGAPPWIMEQQVPALAERVRILSRRTDIVVALDDYAAAHLAAVAPGTPIVLDKHNVLGASVVAESRAFRGPGAWLRARLAIGLTRRFERRALERASAVVVTTPEEAGRLQALYRRSADAVLPTGVAVPSASREPECRTVGWVGLLDARASAAGLERFILDGWAPLAEDGCVLLVAGRRTSVLPQLAGVPGVELLGHVECLDGFLSRLSAGVVPLWDGAGIKVKALTLMAAGVPVAATPVALEGIAARDGEHCRVAREPRALGAALRSLLDDEPNARRLGEAGRALVERDHTWDVVGPRFVRAVEGAVPWEP